MKSFLVRNWFICPAVALAAVFFLDTKGQQVREVRVLGIATDTVTRLYKAASTGDYQLIRDQNLANPDVIAKLKQDDELFGKISTYTVYRTSSRRDDKWSGHVVCVRDRLESVDSQDGMAATVTSLDLANQTVVEDYADSDVTTMEQCRHEAKAIAARHDLKLTKLVFKRAAQGWLATLIHKDKGQLIASYMLFRDHGVKLFHEKLSDYDYQPDIFSQIDSWGDGYPYYHGSF